MENTVENRAKFFALYMGQNLEGKIFIDDDKVDCNDGIYQYGNILVIDRPQRKYLEVLRLKLICKLTEEHAVELAKCALFHHSIEEWNNGEDVWIGDGTTEREGEYILEVGMRCFVGSILIDDSEGTILLLNEDNEIEKSVNSVFIIDFLRSKGYALPWMGLSIEQQVEYGWVLLTS